MLQNRSLCLVLINFLTKGYASNVGVNTLDYKYFQKGKKLLVDSFPVILKPVKLGSSIGCFNFNCKKSQERVRICIDVAFEFDNAIIIEPFISGVKKYNLAGTKVNGSLNFQLLKNHKKLNF